jgi:ribonucleoside-diphosphate reductase alpha chain
VAVGREHGAADGLEVRIVADGGQALYPARPGAQAIAREEGIVQRIIRTCRDETADIDIDFGKGREALIQLRPAGAELYAETHLAYIAELVAAIERGETFAGFEKSKYARGEVFDKYTDGVWEPATDKVRQLFVDAGIRIPVKEDWLRLKESVQKNGIYNQNLQAVPPTGSISYINHSTSSIHPVASKVEIRKEGKIGRVYYPAPYMTNDNLEYYQDAYEIGYEKIIDTYAAATQHVDQGLSLTLFFKDTVDTREVNKAQIYAWRKGIKTLYYIRLRQLALEGTEVEGCVSCML